MRLSGQSYRLQRNPSIIGMWAVVGGGGTMKIHSQYNLASLTDNGVGDFTLSYVIPFASASDYAVVGGLVHTSPVSPCQGVANPPTASTVRMLSFDPANPAAAVDFDPVTVLCVGRR